MTRNTQNFPKDTEKAIQAFIDALGKGKDGSKEEITMAAGIYTGTAGDVADAFVALKLATKAHKSMEKPNLAVYNETLARIKNRTLSTLTSGGHYSKDQLNAAYNALMNKAGVLEGIEASALKAGALMESYYQGTSEAITAFKDILKPPSDSVSAQAPTGIEPSESYSGDELRLADAFTGLMNLEMSGVKNANIKTATVDRIKSRLFAVQTLNDEQKAKWEEAFAALKNTAAIKAKTFTKGNNRGDMSRGVTD
jgi:hypothetical protein